MNQFRTTRVAALVGAAVLIVAACGAPRGSGAGGGAPYDVGVSNTLQGNGWREQMICSINAEARRPARSPRSPP